MRNLLTIGFLSFCCIFSSAQTTGDCNPPSVLGAYLDVNQVKALISPAGTDWFDANDANYEVPMGSGKHVMFARGLIIGGIDPGGNLRLAGETYRQTGNDFWPGPVQQGVTATQTTCNAYDRVYKLNKSTVDSMRALFGTAGYTIPQSILTWPGNGDTTRGEPLKLAPFQDANNNGIYEPQLGEYPGFDYNSTRWYFNELHGDQVIYKVFNDVGNLHSETGALPLGIEVHLLAYAFSAPGTPLDQQTFYDVKIINRSNQTYTNVYLGMMVDTDIGNYQDDLLGTDVSRGLAFAYNGDNDDEGGSGYGLNPPAAGIRILQGPLAYANDGVDNDRDGTIDEMNEDIRLSNVFDRNQSCATHGPSHTLYDHIQSIGTKYGHLRYGNSGCEQNAPDADFMYPGNSDTTIGWGLGGTSTSPFPSGAWFDPTLMDKRMYLGMGPVTFGPGETLTYAFAAVFGRSSSGGPMASLETMKTNSDICQNVFNQLYAQHGLDVSFPEEGMELDVFPNPAKDFINIKGLEMGKQNLIRVYSLTGNLLYSRYTTDAQAQLERPSAASGLCILVVETETGRKIRQKIVFLD